MAEASNEVPQGQQALIIGIPVVDMVAYVDQFPNPGGHSPGTALTAMPGGPAVNVASATARLGHTVKLLGKVGDDHLGGLLRREVQRDGVHIPAAFTVPGGSTATVLVIYDDSGAGEMRSFSFRRGTADSQLTAGDLTRYQFDGVQALFLDGILALDEALTQAGERAAFLAREQGARIFLDPNFRVPGETLHLELGARVSRLARQADELLLNEAEASLLLAYLGEANAANSGIEALGNAIRKRFPNLQRLVIKRGAEGSSVFEGTHYFEQPAFRISVSDTSGAGDSFDGAWITAFLEGKSVEEAARLSSAVAALTVSGKGAWASLPTRRQAERFLATAVHDG